MSAGSNTRKRSLGATVTLLLVVGIVFACTPFVGSLKPNAKANAALARIDTSKIERGDYTLLPHPGYGKTYGGYSWAIFVYRMHDGTIRSWDLQVRNGHVGMPDLHWWRPFHACKNFGPTQIDGVVDETAPIKCHDTDQFSDWWQSEWRWDISGRNLGRKVDDLRPTKGFIEGKYLVVRQ